MLRITHVWRIQVFFSDGEVERGGFSLAPGGQMLLCLWGLYRGEILCGTFGTREKKVSHLPPSAIIISFFFWLKKGENKRKKGVLWPLYFSSTFVVIIFKKYHQLLDCVACVGMFVSPSPLFVYKNFYGLFY
jgi:hypothetical protein